MKRNYVIFKMLYFSVYLSMATFYPLLGKYYKELNFTGTEIGILFGSTTLATMLIQPIWGIICDKRGKCKESFLIMQISLILIALVLPLIRSYYSLLFVTIIQFSFYCGLSPAMDTMVFKDVHDFGKIRLWGSLGFAIMALFSGEISEMIGTNNMFYLYSATLVISLFITLQLKEVEIEIKHKEKKSILKTLTELANAEFILFVLINFFLLGLFTAGGSYYSILFVERSGSMTMFGISYFFLAISEVPFLRLSNGAINRFGSEKALILAGFILLMRYFIYGVAGSYIPLVIFSVVAGSFVGFILPAGAQYLRKHVKVENRSTAVGIYSSASYGLGAMLFQLFGGVVYDKAGISKMYLYFCVFILIGIILAVVLLKRGKRKNTYLRPLRKT